MSRNTERALHYHQLKQYTLAIAAYDAALAEFPDNALLLGNRAEQYILVGRYDEAIRDFQIALRDKPNEEAFWVNYGLALQGRGHFDAAKAAYEHALEVGPSNPFAHFNYGVLLERDLGEHGAGLKHFEKALEIEPGFNHGLGGKSFHDLKHGNFIEGWKEFEYRVHGAMTQMPGLIWDGKQTSDKLILVAEQGMGDVIQFSRYAKVAAMNGQPTALYCPKEMHALLSSLDGVEMLSKSEEVVEPYQWLPLMSMPRIMGTTIDTIPAGPSYLHSTPEKIEHWKKEIFKWSANHEIKIGICWQPGHQWLPHAFARIIPLEMFKAIAAIPGITLFSLQKDEPATQIEDVDFQVIDLGGDPVPRVDTFMDNAAIMENLDLVISTDTSVLHVAGAVGVKTFAVLPKGTCWRWLLDRDDSPWYPSMKLFRQTEVHDWTDVFARITAEVQEMRNARFSHHLADSNLVVG